MLCCLLLRWLLCWLVRQGGPLLKVRQGGFAGGLFGQGSDAARGPEDALVVKLVLK